MKKIILPCLLLVAVAASAQKLDATKVPPAVKTAFSKTFPDVKTVKWELEDGTYEASFKQNDKNMSAIYDNTGKWVETETAIKVSKLPASITTYMQQHYKGIKVKEAAKIKKASGETNYEAEISGKDVVFDEAGKFIKETKD